MDDDLKNFFQLDPSKTLHYPMRLGSKSGLFKSRIGLNMTVRRGLFHYGKIKIECVGDIVENGVQTLYKMSATAFCFGQGLGRRVKNSQMQHSS